MIEYSVTRVARVTSIVEKHQMATAHHDGSLEGEGCGSSAQNIAALVDKKEVTPSWTKDKGLLVYVCIWLFMLVLPSN